ncbi:Copine domain-containing protein [Rozella allomycis CSF55]|uniref:Copine domain-containing protein n=1 Tax=Rozella allomycis (strain CSF55) TaxID=988480 RepID=A0A075ASV9_ROZAC|nr:Copine domain-containing protein [Rozella allomycis CSF55]|eukprot:EPZ33376.1 Copine domain-containing protein [Rozella allomycis CSF55]
MEFSGSELTTKGKPVSFFSSLFSSDKFFYKITRSKPDNPNDRIISYESEIVKNPERNPKWKKVDITFSRLCQGIRSTPLRFELFKFKSNGKNTPVGSFETFALINDQYKSTPGYQNSGIIKCLRFEMFTLHSFVDYLRSGWEISTAYAIDFTASNGPPNAPNSLHYIYGNFENDYARAITAVGEIISNYDRDQMFPVYGFGAKFPNEQVLFDFNCTLDPNNEFVFGTEGVLQAYKTALSYVTLWGPTNFEPMIRKFCNIARKNANEKAKVYSVLLIITDGEITDLESTKQVIIQEACVLPLSIIIVGVGNADFSSMEVLDGDGGALCWNGINASADIVQFVPLRDMKNKEMLAQCVLAELPGQFLNYVRKNNIQI